MKIRTLLALIGFLSAPAAALAQSSPGLVFGQVPTAAQWNSYFAAKQDVLGFTPVNKNGDVMLGPLVTAASTASLSGFNLPPGVAPTTPANGDMWTTGTGFFGRVGGTTFQFQASGGGLALNNNNIYVGNASNLAVGVPMSGDCSIVASGAITCTKLNSVSPGAIFGLNIGTGLSSGSGNLNLANTAVTPATYTNATVTVDQQGRITSASSGVTARQRLSGNLTLFFRTDGNNACNGTVNSAGSSGNCAFADPGFCISFVSANIDRAGFAVTCQAGETTAKTFSPAVGGYVCNSPFTGGGTTTVSGNLGQATVTTPIASPGVVNWTAHGFAAGQPVYLTVSGGSLPTGLSTTGLFFVIAAGLTANAFEVASTVGGTAINFTGTSTGTQTGNAITTLIDGTTNSTTAISIQGSCNLTISNLRLKATVNDLEVFGGGNGIPTASAINIIFDGTPAGNDVFTGRNANYEIDGTDWVMGNSAASHIQGGHGAEARNVGFATNIVNGNKTYGAGVLAFVYGSYQGRVVYTNGPVINLNGFTVTGTRCAAEVLGIVEQAGLGANFFPGNVACTTAQGGQLVQ
jgi:hypothetical protein